MDRASPRPRMREGRSAPRRWLRRIVQLSAVIGAVLAARPLLAIHRETPFIYDLSNHPGGFSRNVGPSRGEPLRDSFESISDLKNVGSVGSEIYRFTLGNASPDARTLAQITNFPGDSN